MGGLAGLISDFFNSIGQNRSGKWPRTRPVRWPNFVGCRENFYAEIAGGRTRRPTGTRRAAQRMGAERQQHSDAQALTVKRPRPIGAGSFHDHSAQAAALGDLNDRFNENCEHWGRRRATLYWAEALQSLLPLPLPAGKATKQKSGAEVSVAARPRLRTKQANNSIRVADLHRGTVLAPPSLAVVAYRPCE
jgi:hypothetical protein